MIRSTTIRWLAAAQARMGAEAGQATAEYALVLVAAAAIAVALIVWATSSGTLASFFNAVMSRVRAAV
jgi:hypothetical protein